MNPGKSKAGTPYLPNLGLLGSEIIRNLDGLGERNRTLWPSELLLYYVDGEGEVTTDCTEHTDLKSRRVARVSLTSGSPTRHARDPTFLTEGETGDGYLQNFHLEHAAGTIDIDE